MISGYGTFGATGHDDVRFKGDCVAKLESCSGPNFWRKPKSQKRSMIASVALSKSPMNLAQGDEIPQIITRRTRQRPSEFWTPPAKRLLQHNQGKTGSSRPTTKN